MTTKSTLIYHIVKENEFLSSVVGNNYVPATLQNNDFVHCSLETSVVPVANDYYKGVKEKLLLLRIDPLKLKSRTKYESAMPESGAGTSHISSSPVFPHVYGPIEKSAIDGIGVLGKEESGYVWPKEFKSVEIYFEMK
jgi:uncharacterized protein (DUF952 family)